MPSSLTQPRAGADHPMVGRLAPSPTGLLHLGHARSFLVAWWQARAAGGRVVLRIDDLDGARAEPKLSDAAMRDLEWLGLDWDGAPRWQSAHVDELTDAAERLLERGLAYPCVCSRGDVRRAGSAPHRGEAEARYPGTCRARFSSRAEAESSGRPVGLRFRVLEGPVEFCDGVTGVHRVDVSAEVGDFLVMRRGAQAAYQLAVVVDDAAQGVTDVVRGDDLLPSTARQLLLQRALGLPQPRWWHLPLVVDAAGQRLAKRHDALSLAELRGRGVDPRAIVAWAARASGLDVPRRATPLEVAQVFDWSRLPRAAIVAPNEFPD